MSHFELLYIIPTSLSEEEAKPIKEGVLKVLDKYEAKVTLNDDLGRKKLAYPIKHQHNGYYTLIEFDLDGTKLKDVNEEMRLTPEIFRHMIVSKKVKTTEELAKEKETKERIAQKRALKAMADKPAEEKKEEVKEEVSAEELDKKLDEILDPTL